MSVINTGKSERVALLMGMKKAIKSITTKGYITPFVVTVKALYGLNVDIRLIVSSHHSHD